MRPKRKSIAEAEWHVSAELVRHGISILQTEVPLRISDSHLNAAESDTGTALAGWLNDQALVLARREAAMKKTRRR